MQRELDVYSEYKTILGDTLSKKYLPDIYYFDSKLFFVLCNVCLSTIPHVFATCLRLVCCTCPILTHSSYISLSNRIVKYAHAHTKKNI